MTHGAPVAAPVAVVIPTFNHAHYLGDAIASVLAQTVPPADILVVDDGSLDHPEEVVAAHPGVRLLRQENRGLAAARNTGLWGTSAPFLLFLDADDELRPQAIERSVERLSQAPLAAFSYGAYADKLMPSGEVVEAAFRPVPREAFPEFLRVNPIGMHGTVMYRRQCLEAVGGFRERLAASEDYDVYLRLSMNYQVTCGPEVLANYRQHGQNMSTDPAFMLQAVLRVLHSHRSAAIERGRQVDYRAGLKDWKLHYLTVWAQRINRDGVDARALRQGLTLARLAPLEMALKVIRVAASRSGRSA